ncbi:hypothetical protein CBM2634_A220007 [Cupriavidus taiwanensis]|uniref:Uncharacterized protein n=1 Tax=Cupriavidus taiwanensis TaxID=164546 RepID=A0A375IYB5_9BURK|nr:hypothetical protein CBM2634_A220007 [Cupriavidus taiwanensis]
MWRVRRFGEVLPARLAKLKVYGRGALSGMLLVTSLDDIATGAPGAAPQQEFLCTAVTA